MLKRCLSNFAVVLLASTLVVSCAQRPREPRIPLPSPETLDCPEPIRGNGGRYLSPYTSDGVVAEWVDQATQVRVKAEFGKLLGALLGAATAEREEKDPVIGAVEGAAEGEERSRQAAIDWLQVRRTSDLSFESLDNMAVYLYVHHSSHPHYWDALEATWEIYPELKTRYCPAVLEAARR